MKQVPTEVPQGAAGISGVHGGEDVKATTLICHRLPGLSLDEIEAKVGSAVLMTDCDHRPESIRSQAQRAHAQAIVCILRDRIDERVLSTSGLRIVANVAVGFDNIDTAAARAHGVLASNTPEVLTDSTADLTFALMLAVARRLTEGDALVRSGSFRGWELDLLLGRDVHGAQLGVVGMGRIGQALAKRAIGFDMRVCYHQRHRLPAALEASLALNWCSLEELLSQSDFIALMVPLSETSRHMISRRQLALVKPGAILVNTSRGPVVDETALIEALASGHLGGAGLDVYEREPLVSAALLGMANVVLLPHLGSATWATRRAMALVALDNVAAALSGRRPPNLVGA